jgi:hypothetical protein
MVAFPILGLLVLAPNRYARSTPVLEMTTAAFSVGFLAMRWFHRNRADGPIR